MTDATSSELSLHFSVQRAVLAKAELRQLDVLQLDRAPSFVLAHAFTPPRLWGFLLDTSLDGFFEGFERPHDGRASARLHQAMRAAQQALRTRVDSLIERRSSDVALLALSLEGDLLHVLGAGSLRAYVYRHRTLRRLGPSESAVPDGDGILKLSPSLCAEPVEADDLVFATAGSICNEATLDKLTRALDREPSMATGDVVNILNEAAAKHRKAAASLAFRLPSRLPR